MSEEADLRALRAARDLAGMAVWLADQGRVDRMLTATGDYVAVLADIRAAHEYVRDLNPPDLAAGLKLALAREDISSRIDGIPAEALARVEPGALSVLTPQ